MDGPVEEPIRVLHVDDDRDLAGLLADCLEREHPELAVATEPTAADGLEHLRSKPVDCVVSDHDMPGMDGLEFLRAVRDQWPDLPFVLFTGKGSEEIASEAISAGVTEYLQKGSGTDQFAVLANRVERAVSERRARAALEESRRRLATLISNLPGIVYRCRDDRGWPMTFVGGDAAALTGYEASEIESGAVDWERQILHPEDREPIRDEVEAALEAGDPFEVTYRIQTRSGEQKWCWERGRAVDAEDGSRVLEGFITDVTDRKRRERRLEEYASVVSHDLAGPLAVIRGSIEHAQATGDLAPLDRADEASQRMEELIDDLEALARHDERPLNRESVALDAVARAAWRQVETPHSELTVATDARVEADPSRLQALFENLFRNAVEHGSTSPDSQAPRDANAEGRGDGSGEAERDPNLAEADRGVAVRVGDTESGFFVADDGRGIPPEERSAVFERGYSTDEDGTGYGLAIVGTVVDAHGWSVRATESAEGGARFEVDTESGG